MHKVLVVEDEMSISHVLKAYLRRAGFFVEQASSGEEAMEKFHAFKPSLVLLDVMLPGIDGWSVLSKFREQSACPVIMLTALDDVEYKLTGLNQGADDYITKPFNGEEVVARVNAVLRRPVQMMETDKLKTFGSLKINFQSHAITLHGVELYFTPRDLSLLLFLAKHPNQTFTREQLIEQVWGIDYEGSDRAVDLAIKRIRRVLHRWPPEDGEIRTLRGLGYQLHVHQK